MIADELLEQYDKRFRETGKPYFITTVMKEFAKYRVKEALTKVKNIMEYNDISDEIKNDMISNAYLPENIK